MLSDQADLRKERNFRIHEGVERGFTQDDTTFRFASLFEHRYGRARGQDRFGRRINVRRFFNEALVEVSATLTDQSDGSLSCSTVCMITWEMSLRIALYRLSGRLLTALTPGRVAAIFPQNDPTRRSRALLPPYPDRPQRCGYAGGYGTL